MISMRPFLILCFAVLTSTCFGQFKFEYNDSIPVKIGNDTLLFPWAGGLNYVQVSDIDYDFDGDLDLFIFDRSKDNIRLFETVQVNGVSKYKFVQRASDYFPAGVLKNRAALIDYDNDGRNDLFTYGIGGLKVYKNVGDVTNGLQWQLISNLLYSDYAGDHSNLYVSSSDIPALVDVDGDLDLDVLTFHIGGERIEYHQNQSQEMYGHSDSLIFVLKNECWGKFKEDPNNNSLILNDTTVPCSIPNIPNPLKPSADQVTPVENEEDVLHTRHAGSTILALDVDNSGVLDLVIGDVSHNNLILVVNGGTEPNTNSAMVSQDENFPSNTTPATLKIFPASFYVDVDHDGIKDLIVGANAKGVSQNEKSVLYYKNLGADNLPNFLFKSKSFLQEEMIEAGTGSIPVFFDQNNDGKKDLIIGSFYRYKETLSKESALNSYRNTGTSTDPFFTFVDLNYLNITAQNYGLRSVPAFGDIDSDGDDDLFLGLENGTLVFYKNTAAVGFPASFAAPVLNYTDQAGTVITTDSYCFPQLFDLDNDGLLDLILGKKTGEIMYYKNTGTAALPAFSLTTAMLGGIDISPTTPEGYAAPHFFRLNDTTNLFLGGIDGKLHFYNDIDGNLATGESFHLISDAYLGINVEGYSSFYVNDLDNDGKLNLFVGGDLGGLMHYEHDPNSVLAVDELTSSEMNIAVYPNPSEGIFNISIEAGNSADWQVEVFDLTGRKIPISADNNQIDLSGFGNGIYHLILRNQESGKMVSKKVVKH